MSVDPYLGLWTLVSSDESAVYTILSDAEGLFFHVRYTEAGQVLQSQLRGDLSGRPVPLQEGFTLSTQLTDEGLITELCQGGELMHREARSLHQGQLRVCQRVRTAAGWQESEDRYRRTSAKQVMVYRRDLKMRKGKIAAQCAHGSLGVFFRRARGPAQRLEIEMDGPMSAWARGRFAKVVLSCASEADLLRIAEEAKARGLPHIVITDAGKTEFHGVPTRTVVAIGPAAVEEIDPITGKNGLVACKLA